MAAGSARFQAGGNTVQNRLLAPAQILVPEWKRPDSFTCDLENRLGNGVRDLWGWFFAPARDPFVVWFHELDVDLPRGVRPAGNLVILEVALRHPSALDRAFLPPRC